MTRSFGLWLVIAAGLVPTTRASAADGPGTYTNPVYPQDFPDPFVLAHNGKYHAYATHKDATGFQHMESSDLVHWTPRKLDFPVPWSEEHYWAPEVFEQGGKFYLTYSALDPVSKKHQIAVATADDPAGPFTHRAILVRGDDNKVGVIDATIALDEAGKPFLIYSEETPRRIVARSLNADLLGVGAEVKEIIRPDQAWESGVTEAPTIVKRGGLYHLFYSGGPYEGVKDGPRYAVGHASATSLLGPYAKTPAPILTSVEGKVYGPGHQCYLTTPDGKDWLLYHAWDAVGQPKYGQNPSGRTLRIDRVEWHGETPRVLGPTVTPYPAPDASVKAPPGTAPGRISALDEDYNALERAFYKAYFGTKDDAEKREISRRLRPDAAGHARKFLALAKEDPTGSGAADALYNVLMLQETRISPDGQEALTWLARDFATSPRMGFFLQQLSLQSWPEIEPMLRDVLARNPDRTSKGQACLGLAMKIGGRATIPKIANDPAMARQFEVAFGKEQYAAILKQDVPARLAEATALYRRVLAEFADVRYFPDYPNDDRTLGPRAKTWLDRQDDLAIGKPAPAIEGKDLDGKAFALADFRGKVVALVFWASWCHFCIEQVPHDRELARQMQGRPFALLGVNCDHKPEDARESIAKQGITWPNWYDGDPRDGKIASNYHVEGIPMVLVIDGDGIIRDKDVRGEALTKSVENLLKEREGRADRPKP